MNRGVAFAIAGGLFAAGFAVRGLVQPKPAAAAESYGSVAVTSPGRAEEIPESTEPSPARVRVLSARGGGESTAGPASTEADLGERFRAALSGRSSAARQEELRRWAAGLSAAEMRSAVAMVARVAGRRERESTMRALVTRWGALDAPAAIAYVEGLPAGGEQDRLLSSAVLGLASTDPAAAAIGLRQLPEAARADALQPVLREMAARDPQAALRLHAELAGSGRSAQEALRAIYREWAGADPAAAWSAALQDRDPRSVARAVLDQWAYEDPAAALRAAATTGHADYVGQAIRIWARDDPAAAGAYVSALPDAAMRATAAEALAREWGARDAGAAVAWVARQGDGAVRAQAYTGIAEAVARTDPRAAAQMVGAIADPAARVGAARAVARAWARTEPVEAGAWAGRGAIPDGMERGHVLGEVVQQWAPKDPDGAGRWLESLPAGLSRDVAVRYYAWKIEDMDAGAAVQWASTIRQDQLRVTQQETAARAWLRQDQAAARSWIAGSNLSAEAKARLTGPAAPAP